MRFDGGFDRELATAGGMTRLGKVEGGAVGADVVRNCSFSWVVPEVAGTYAKEVGLFQRNRRLMTPYRY